MNIKAIIAALSLSVVLYAQDSGALVAVEALQKKMFGLSETFKGSVQFDKKSALSIEGSGIVEKVFFQRGDHLEKGSVMLQLDTRLLQKDIAAANASVAVAQSGYDKALSDFTRDERLYNDAAISQQRYEDSHFALRSKQASLEQAKAQLERLELLEQKATLHAPYSGVVTQKSVAKGQWVASGSAVAQLVSSNKLQLEFYVDAPYSATLQKGKEYAVMLAGKKHVATLQAKLPQGDQVTRTFVVVLGLQTDQFVYEGMPVAAEFPKLFEKNRFVVLRDAITKRFDGDAIFVSNEEDKAQLIPVQVLGYKGEVAAIEAQQLREGMRVVTKGNERIYPDQKLRIITP